MGSLQIPSLSGMFGIILSGRGVSFNLYTIHCQIRYVEKRTNEHKVVLKAAKVL